jgi:hypothetical protein
LRRSQLVGVQGEPAVRQEAADELDAERSTLVVANAYKGPQQRTG